MWNAINKAVRVSIALAIGFAIGADLTHSTAWVGGRAFAIGSTTITRALLGGVVIGGLVFLAIWTDHQAQRESAEHPKP